MPSKRQLAAEAVKFSADLSEFLLKVREIAVSQFEFNLKQNVPRGILEIEQCAAHAVNNGIVSAMSSRAGFCVISTLEMCGDLLEDVNASTEAALVRDLAKKEAAS